MPEPGTIPDPRMNPIGERAFGTAFNHLDGHYYYYIKGKNDLDPNLGSRYLAAGTLVELEKVYPAFLVVPRLSSKEIKTYRSLDFDKPIIDPIKEKEELELKTKLQNLGQALVNCINNSEELKSKVDVEIDWKKVPAIVDLIEVTQMSPAPDQKVMKKVNKHIKDEILKKELN